MARAPLAESTNTVARAKDSDDEAMRKWRRDWRRIMAVSVCYFDGIDPHDVQHIKDHLTLLGTRFQAFFDASVTHVITKRDTKAVHARGDVLHKAPQLGMKVWTMDKLVKFLTALLGYSPTSALDSVQSAKLSQLLRQEKLQGPQDRDPTARRDDYHYFKGPYLLIWDPSHYNRTLLQKEWPRAANPHDGEWPQFRSTPVGMCPFVQDVRRRRGEPAKKRRALQQIDNEIPLVKKKLDRYGGKENAPIIYEVLEEAEEQEALNDAVQKIGNSSRTALVAEKQSAFQERSPGDSRTNSRAEAIDDPEVQATTYGLEVNNQLEAPKEMDSNTMPGLKGKKLGAFRKYCEITASGVQRSATSAVKSTVVGETGNGLGVAHSLVSREVRNLERKVLQPVASGPRSDARAKLRKAGYCENCCERFEDFEAHTRTRQHQKYASNSDKFFALDAIIAGLARPSRFEE